MLRDRCRGVGLAITLGLATAALTGCTSSAEPDGGGGRQGVSQGGSSGQNASGGSSGTPSGTGGSGGSPGSGGVGAGSGGTAGDGAGTAGVSGAGGPGGTGGEGAGGAAGGGTAGDGAAGGGQAGGGGTAGSGGGGGGTAGSGGSGGAAAGAAGAGGAPITCMPPRPATGGTQYCSNTKGVLSSGYAYELWAAGGGSGCMRVPGVNANYSASWTAAADFLARAGLRFDSTQTPAQIGTITAQFSETFTEVPVQGATSKIYVALYGWTIDPLMEYYVIEDYGGFVPGPTASDGSPRTNYGTLTVDDGTYDIWALPVTNRPAITGNNMNFTQIFNVRRVPRKCGQISLSEHFTKWSAVGLTLGKLEEAMFLMEAQNNSGTIDVTATVTLN